MQIENESWILILVDTSPAEAAANRLDMRGLKRVYIRQGHRVRCEQAIEDAFSVASACHIPLLHLGHPITSTNITNVAVPATIAAASCTATTAIHYCTVHTAENVTCLIAGIGLKTRVINHKYFPPLL